MQGLLFQVMYVFSLRVPLLGFLQSICELRYMSERYNGAIVYYNGNITCCFSAFSAVADPDLQKTRRPNHPDPEISGGGGSQKFFFGPSGLILV